MYQAPLKITLGDFLGLVNCYLKQDAESDQLMSHKIL